MPTAPDRYAVIDAGTNSVKFLVAERMPDGSWRAVVDRATMTRLGEKVQERGVIGADAIERTAAAIAGMAEEARELGALDIAAVGTAGLRMAGNRADVVAAIADRSGVVIEVIPGDEEARLAYLATAASLGTIEGPLAVFDSGGGSSQFTFGHAGAIDARFSVNAGAVRYTERFGLADAVSRKVLAKALAAISADLEALDGHRPVDRLIGMGGGVTSIASVSYGMRPYDPERIHGTVLESGEIDRQIELYRTRGTDERRSIAGLQPKRADVILAGACIVRTIMDRLAAESFTVSDRGLRHGLLVERFGSRRTATRRRAIA